MITLSPEKKAELQSKLKGTSTQTTTKSSGSLSDRLQAIRQKRVEEEKWRDKGVVGNLFQDVKETGSAIKGTVVNTGKKFKESFQANQAGQQTPIETGTQYAATAIGGATGVLGDLFIGGAKAVTPEFAERGVSKGIEKVVESKPAQKVLEKWKSLSPRAKRNLKAVGDIASVIPAEKAVGLATKGIKSVAPKAIVQASEKAIGAVKKPIVATKNVSKDVVKSAISKATGLEPETISTIYRNPEKFSRKNIQTTDREAFAQSVKKDVEAKIEDLSETGKGYTQIRESRVPVKVPQKGIKQSLKKEHGITVKDGKVFTDKNSKTRLNKAEAKKLEEFLETYGDSDTLDSNSILNARQDLDKIADWEGGIGKSKPLQGVAKSLRAYYDKKAKAQVPGLKEVDTEFSAKVTDLNKIRDEIIEKKGPYKGELKPNAISKLANLTGKGKERLLAELEKMRPGIGQEVKIIRAMEDYAVAKGNKVGAYGSALVQGGVGAGIALGSPWVIPAIMAYPSIAINILRGAGTVAKFGKGAVDAVVNKVRKGEKLTAKESVIVDEALSQKKPSRKVRETIKEKAPEVYQKYMSNKTYGTIDDMFTSEKDLPVIDFGKEGKSKFKSGDKNLPVVKEAPNVFAPLMDNSKKKLKSLNNSEEMVTVYHASPKMPKSGNWRKGTMFADTEQNARYYAESHHRGNITVKKVTIPKRLVEKNKSNNIYNLKEEYPISFKKPNKQGGYLNLEGLFGDSKKKIKADDYDLDIGSSIQKAKKEGKNFDEWLKTQGQPVYHGSSKEITEFDPNKTGLASSLNSAKGKYFFASDKQTADTYASARYLSEKYGDLFDLDKKLGVKEKLKVAKESMGKGGVTQAYLKYKNPKIYKMRGILSDKRMERDFKKAIDNGHDAVIFKDVIDVAMQYSPDDNFRRTDVIVVFDKNQIKTKSQLEDMWNKANKNSEKKQEKNNFGGVILYHGSPVKNLKSLKGSKPQGISDIKGISFSSDKKYAKDFGENIYKRTINPKNPFIVEDGKTLPQALKEMGYKVEQNDQGEWLLNDIVKKNGYDVIIMKGNPDEYVVIDKKILKKIKK